MASWNDVRKIAKGLPELQEASKHDWRVRNKMVAWERPLRKADVEYLGAEAPTGPILGVRVIDEGVKLSLIADNPGVYFTTPHFNGYPAVLVRLREIPVDELAELMEEAWLDRAPKTIANKYLAEQQTNAE